MFMSLSNAIIRGILIFSYVVVFCTTFDLHPFYTNIYILHIVLNQDVYLYVMIFTSPILDSDHHGIYCWIELLTQDYHPWKNTLDTLWLCIIPMHLGFQCQTCPSNHALIAKDITIGALGWKKVVKWMFFWRKIHLVKGPGGSKGRGFPNLP